MAVDTSYEDADRWIGRILAGGLILSIAVMILGLILVAVHGGSTHTVLPLDRVGSQIIRGNAPAILDLGILILFATPLAGVIAAFINFLARRNGAFTAVTAALLVLLVIGFLVALR